METQTEAEQIRNKKGLLNALNNIAREKQQEEYKPFLKCGHKRRYLENGKCWVCSNTKEVLKE